MDCSKSAQLALILIPCCREKRISDPGVEAPPIQGIVSLRESLIDHIIKTPELAKRAENQGGILNREAPRTPARELYCGNLFQACCQALFEKHPSIHILVVSALYGLTRLGENLRQYELTMSDKLWDGRLIYRFWENTGLSGVLRQYVRDYDISCVWSLLPDTQEAPYHRVFRQFWLNPDGAKCYRVKVFLDNGASAGQGCGRKRGEWLNQIISTNPALLCEPKLLPQKFRNIPGFRFDYVQA